MTRSRALALGALALVCASTLAAQGATPPTIDQLQSVVSPIGAGEPAVWSVDGTRLIYVGGDGLLASVGVDGGAPMRYAPALQDERQMERMLHAPSLGGASQLRRSPDGRMVTYVKGVAGGNDIFGFDIAAGTERRITRLSGHVRSYAFSPTGDRIALANDRNGSEDVYVVEVATGVATRLTSSPLYEGFPSFTPDGNRVIYTRLDSRWVDHEVFSIRPTGRRCCSVHSGTGGPTIGWRHWPEGRRARWRQSGPTRARRAGRPTEARCFFSRSRTGRSH